MAEAKQARVLSTEKLNEITCRVFCEMISPAELGFTGGQYIIVNSKMILASGKIGKRAYSIPSSDNDQKKIELIVRRIHDGEGIGSKFIHDLKPGDIFEFSGPWGKYLPPQNAENVLIVATDTGITAALGLIRGKKFAAKARMIWFVESENYFLPFSTLPDWNFVIVPPAGQSLRMDVCKSEIEKVCDQKKFDQIYLSGDGRALAALKDMLLAGGYEEEQILMETFFNHLERKASMV